MRTIAHCALLLLGLWCMRPSFGHAQEAEPQRTSEQARSITPGALPTALALVPGLVLHGSGTFFAGDRPAAKRLAWSGAVGFATFFVSGAILAGTGTARRLVGPVAPFVIAGASVFFLSWFADIYGAATGGREASVSPFLPTYEGELGYRYVHDPQFAYANFMEARLHLRHGRLRASPSAIVAMDDDNQRLELELAYRLFGRPEGVRSDDGSYLEVTSGLIHHRYGSERFAVWTPELSFAGRLDLAHVGKSLRGAFVEGSLGAGLELYAFSGSGTRPRESAYGLLLARAAFGVYFGGNGAVRNGEASLYYDHRHDDFAAGFGLQGIASGILGHLGAAAHYYFSANYGIGALFEIGAAAVSSLTFRYRRGRS